MTPSRAPLIEVFHSVQGEGRFLGEPMAFVRVATCPLRCRYCDTPDSWVATADFAVHGDGERAATHRERNPVTAARAVELALGCAARSPWRVTGFARVSITGGEPLVFPRFVREFGEALGARGAVHLETSAHDAQALAECLPALSHVSADWKLPETLESGDWTAQHRACVELVAADGRATLDVKIVLMRGVAQGSLSTALDALAPFKDALLLVLQPVTPARGVAERIDAGELARCAAMAGERGFRYRVLAQLHPLLGLR
ncbi:MAG: 7-carboxy-7-deazaguanine synthase QueE [Planctomycetes bacterium]|nr:7-carboxy-7-deazaguanine synthase QueE [Planctomycetota bacterium]